MNQENSQIQNSNFYSSNIMTDETQIKKIRGIRTRSIINLVFYVLTIILVAISYSNVISLSMSYDPEVESADSVFMDIIPYLIMLFCSLVISFAMLIMNIVNAVKILRTSWTNSKVNDIKVLWGIFTIFILGSISSLVFSIVALKEIRKEKPTSIYSNNNSNQLNF